MYHSTIVRVYYVSIRDRQNCTEDHRVKIVLFSIQTVKRFNILTLYLAICLINICFVHKNRKIPNVLKYTIIKSEIKIGDDISQCILLFLRSPFYIHGHVYIVDVV